MGRKFWVGFQDGVKLPQRHSSAPILIDWNKSLCECGRKDLETNAHVFQTAERSENPVKLSSMVSINSCGLCGIPLLDSQLVVMFRLKRPVTALTT